MGFKNIDVSSNARGGTELMRDRLINGLRDRKRDDLLEHFDFHASRVRDFDECRPSILLMHDLPGDPESEHLRKDKGARFEHMVFVSNWQFQQYQTHYGLTGENCSVIQNAIELFDDADGLLIKKGFVQPSKTLGSWGLPQESRFKDDFKLSGFDAEHPIRLIYHTTPHRGLEILVPVFEELYNELLDHDIHITLDVFSGFGVYGWNERDAPYEPLFMSCRKHPAITYHGAQDNMTVRRALERSHIFAFPSIWPETSCLALIEAMASGTHVVHSNLAALPETAAGCTTIYPFITDRDVHAGVFYDALKQAIERYRYLGLSVTASAQRSSSRIHDVETYIKQWITLLDSLKTPVD